MAASLQAFKLSLPFRVKLSNIHWLYLLQGIANPSAANFQDHQGWVDQPYLNPFANNFNHNEYVSISMQLLHFLLAAASVQADCPDLENLLGLS